MKIKSIAFTTLTFLGFVTLGINPLKVQAAETLPEGFIGSYISSKGNTIYHTDFIYRNEKGGIMLFLQNKPDDHVKFKSFKFRNINCDAKSWEMLTYINMAENGSILSTNFKRSDNIEPLDNILIQEQIGVLCSNLAPVGESTSPVFQYDPGFKTSILPVKKTGENVIFSRDRESLDGKEQRYFTTEINCITREFKNIFTAAFDKQNKSDTNGKYQTYSINHDPDPGLVDQNNISTSEITDYACKLQYPN
jgi:hypothetical protein